MLTESFNKQTKENVGHYCEESNCFEGLLHRQCYAGFAQRKGPDADQEERFIAIKAK